MCEVIDKIEKRGMEKGIEQGKINLLVSLVKDGDLTIEKASAKLNVSVEEFKKIMSEK